MLFFALFKRAKERFALWRSFCKEQKNELLFCALLEKSKRANRSFLLFLKRAKERRAKERKSDCPTLLFYRVGQSLFRSSLFCSFQKELQGAICSFALFKKSEQERFTLSLFSKRAQKSDSLFHSFKKSA